MKTLVQSLVAVIVVTTVLFFAGYRHEAHFIGAVAPLLVLFSGLIYVVFVHSRKRWPGLRWWQRAVRVLTFQR